MQYKSILFQESNPDGVHKLEVRSDRGNHDSFMRFAIESEHSFLKIFITDGEVEELIEFLQQELKAHKKSN